MSEILKDVILDTLLDSVKILPFLFVTYFIMEYIERRMGEKAKGVIQRSGKFGPAAGGILGIFPQCGFSAAAANLYAGRVITMGTLLAVFFSTSDEMLPILISEQADPALILKILALKAAIGMLLGFLADMVFREKREAGKLHIHNGCGKDGCSCETGGPFGAAVRHTLQIFLFIAVFSFLLNGIIAILGQDVLEGAIRNRPVIGACLSGLVGLLPNCAASVVITQMYLEGFLSGGAMMAGLLTGAGIGLLVLFRENRDLKENLKILALLYTLGVAAGILLDIPGLHIF